MVEIWWTVAYRLWRQQRLGYAEISRFLELEGWDVSPALVAEAVTELAGRELVKKLGAGVVSPPDRHGGGRGSA
jgi:hypothetical protein